MDARAVRALACLLVLASGPAITASDAAGAISALVIEPTAGGSLRIVGPDARLQLLATGKTLEGREIDLTREVQWSATPPGIVEIDSTGLAVPLAEGHCQVVARASGASATLELSVEQFATAPPVHFQNQIVPIFTRLGCNGGGCHGKAAGQNGFRLSLLGFNPEEDYEFLVKESRGRRLFPSAPEMSLLLTKPTGKLPHGGGKRLEQDSPEYRLLHRWIQQGMPCGDARDPIVTGIACVPPARVLSPHSQQQIVVMATYSDGRHEDVTRMALFEPNEPELAESSPTGLVTTRNLSGEVAVMARYQGYVATFRATIPLHFQAPRMPVPRNLIDEAVFAKLKLLGIPPSEPCDDATFLRRASIDIAGTLPREDQVRKFLADTTPDKRDRLIDELLDGPEYADYFSNKWNHLLRNKKRQDLDRDGTYEFHQWIWNAIYENKPYDVFVREIITAAGDPRHNPAVIWYREVSEPEKQVEDTAQLFLGVRIQCARCHHHPYERWSEDDYYSLAAFFSRVAKKEIGAEVARNTRDRRIYHNIGLAQARNPRSGDFLKPAGLDGPVCEIAPERDPRVVLADWMSNPDNSFFAKALVNRYWKHFFNRGIVEPEDDMRETNPPCNPELLENLSAHFIAHGYDLKDLIRLICRSRTYQLSSLPNDDNLQDKQNFSRYYPKRLTAECLYDAFHQVTSTTQTYSGLPAGSRAVEMPDVTLAPYFLKVFGQPRADTACECERSQSANLAQSLHLINSMEVQGKISNPAGRAHQLAQQTSRSHAERVSELYRWVYAREPDQEELRAAQELIDRHPQNPEIAYEDMLWALINTKEFLFTH